MSKIKINTDKIGSLLLAASKAYQSISIVKSFAELVEFPNGEFDWENVCNQIDDCLKMISKYRNWLIKIKNSYEGLISSNIDAISSIDFSYTDENKISVKE